MKQQEIEIFQELDEGLLSRAADMAYAFRFLKLLVTPFNKSKAFELGLVDAKGKKLKKAETPQEKSAYTIFHRLVFNIKRLLNVAGGGVASKIASYASALFLIKDHTGMSEDEIKIVLDKIEKTDWDQLPVTESKWFQNEDNQLNPGEYTLTRDIASPITGEYIGFAKSKVVVEDVTDPYDNFLGHDVYKVIHKLTKQELFITNHDIVR
tara:strand:- start:1038 stop:1664 length:627 start_codon:yes stop_codon:yes gene_type:complete